MDQRHGLNVPQSLSEVCRPEQLGLLVYDMQVGILEQIGDRVSSIVWLDAFKPDDGQKGGDYASDFSRKLMQEAIAKGEISRVAPPATAFFVRIGKEEQAVHAA